MHGQVDSSLYSSCFARNSISSCLGFRRLQLFGTLHPFPPLMLKTISVCSQDSASSTDRFSHYITSPFDGLRQEILLCCDYNQNLTGLKFIFCSITFCKIAGERLDCHRCSAVPQNRVQIRSILSLSRAHLYKCLSFGWGIVNPAILLFPAKLLRTNRRHNADERSKIYFHSRRPRT